MRWNRTLLFLLMLVGSALLICSCGSVSIKGIPDSPPSVRSPKFTDLMEKVANTKTRKGNQCLHLRNGANFFPQILSDISSAKRSITFETFVIRDGGITDVFVKALSAKAKVGVKVHMLIDAVGSRYLGEESIAELRLAGVELEKYKPWWKSLFTANNRDHRKFVIIDGEIAHTGGAGVATVWEGHGNKRWNWRDNQYRITGPIVTDMQKAFCLNWKEVAGRTLIGQDYFPTLKPLNRGMVMQSLISGNEGSVLQRQAIARSYLLAINAAQKDISIGTSYFCPPKQLTRALVKAKERGVRVRILTAGSFMDSKITQRCARNSARYLIAEGIEMYEFQPAMYHSKLMVVDNHLVIAGAANLDYRSFFINDENNFHVFDDIFAQSQFKDFERDLRSSLKLTPKNQKSFSYGAWLMQSQL